MNKLIKLVIYVLTSFTLSVYANDEDICQPETKVIVGFFNGVWTDRDEAYDALDELKKLNLTAPNNKKLVYEVFYNETKWAADLVEVFDQRTKEYKTVLAGRYEYMRILNSSHKWWDRMAAKDLMLNEFFNAMQNATLELIVDGFKTITDNPTAQDYAKHNNRIDNHLLEGNQLLFVAHSQGNLFVNSAHKYTLSKLGKGSNAVKTVHIAPASMVLNGAYVLADEDLVINGLRLVGWVPTLPNSRPQGTNFVPPITHKIPSYWERPKGSNGKTDIKGHGLIEIYLNDKFPANLTTYIPIKNYLQTELHNLEEQPKQGQSGFLTATLTWDGAGDVDLHVFEPDGSHVYFLRTQGKAGALDVDNVVANGPEHYVIACAKDKILAGNYQIKVANYEKAEGRTATINLASSKYGALGFKKIKLGKETGINPPYLVFNFNIKPDFTIELLKQI